MMFMLKKMFLLTGAFVFGYCFGYFTFEIFKYKNRKEETQEFFLTYNKKYGSQHRRHY